MYCPYCGKEIQAGGSFCRYCGHNLQSLPFNDCAQLSGKVVHPHTVYTEETVSEKSKRSAAVIISVLLVVIMIAGAIYGVHANTSKDETESETVENGLVGTWIREFEYGTARVTALFEFLDDNFSATDDIEQYELCLTFYDNGTWEASGTGSSLSGYRRKRFSSKGTWVINEDDSSVVTLTKSDGSSKDFRYEVTFYAGQEKLSLSYSDVSSLTLADDNLYNIDLNKKSQ